MKTSRMSKRGVRVAACAAVLSAAVVGVALATSGSGAVGTIMARGIFSDATDIKFKITGIGEEVLHVPNTQETVMQQVVIAPGGHTGWHSHPGPAIALIKRGVLTLYSSEDPTCTGRNYAAGQAFIDSGQGHVHMARNQSTTDELEVWVTYFDVPPGGTVRNDVPDPGTCTF